MRFLVLMGWVILFGFWLSMGCRSVSQSGLGPELAGNEYLHHIRTKRFEKAYEMLSQRRKAQMDLDTFIGLMQNRQLETGNPDLNPAPMLAATVRSVEGTQINLVKENNAWRIDEGPGISDDRSTPESVVRVFLRAVENADCLALSECAPPALVRKVSMDRLVEGCRKKLNVLRDIAKKITRSRAVPVRLTEHEAELVFQKGKKMLLVRIGRTWYVNDLYL